MTPQAAVTSTAAEHAAHQRIRRLRKAIGDGPHSFTFRPNLHLKNILAAIGDQDALDLLEQERRR